MIKSLIYERCKRCNRILKSEKARKRGYGDHCWKLHQIEVKKAKPTLIDQYIQEKNKK